MVAITDLYQAIRSQDRGVLEDVLFDPDKGDDAPHGLRFAVRALWDAIDPPPENLLPIMPVCDGSFACVVCDHDISDGSFHKGQAHEVVRWHLGVVDDGKQGELLDLDAISYIRSMSKELSIRKAERKSVEKTATNYYNNFVVKGRRPRVDVRRPVQLACQNVIIGLASLHYDAVFDGLRVEAYATCEVAHLATGEADRAMAALLLCDAFQSGGTMEIRFGRANRERPIPPALHRFARVRGIQIGAKDPRAISPAEARELFISVSPMTEELRLRAFEAFDTGVITPERLCYCLMSGLWSDIELSYLLATTPRAPRILEGGSDPEDRMARCAESESCRAAAMVGMLKNRLENGAPKANQSPIVEVLEDWRLDSNWVVLSEVGAVAFAQLEGNEVPWLRKGTGARLKDGKEALVVLPRGMPFLTDAAVVARLQEDQPEAAVFLLVPSDADMSGFPGVPFLRCPQTLDVIDQSVRGKLDTLRISRR